MPKFARAIPLSLCALSLITVGCGGDDGPTKVDVNQIVKTAEKDQRAKARLTIDVSGPALKQPLKVTASGTMSLTELAADLAFDAQPIAKVLGAPTDVSPKQVRIVLTPTSGAIEVPEALRSTVTEGKPWIGASLDGVAEDTAKALSAVLSLTVSDAAPVYAKAGFKQISSEKINGVDTTRWDGTVSVADALSVLPKDKREAAEKTLTTGALAIPKADFERKEPLTIWLDATGRVHRYEQQAKSRSTKDTPSFDTKIRVDYSDFGSAPEIKAPATSEIFDATEALRKAAQTSARTETG